MIITLENGDIKMSSFTKDDILYDIVIDQASNEIISCSCADHKSSNANCKHMYLVIDAFIKE